MLEGHNERSSVLLQLCRHDERHEYFFMPVFGMNQCHITIPSYKQQLLSSLSFYSFLIHSFLINLHKLSCNSPNSRSLQFSQLYQVQPKRIPPHKAKLDVLLSMPLQDPPFVHQFRQVLAHLYFKLFGIMRNYISLL